MKIEHVGVTNNSIFVDVSEHFMTTQVFESKDAVVQWCQEVGFRLKTVIIIQRSESGSVGRKPRLQLWCERSGFYISHKKKSNDPKKQQVLSVSEKRSTGSKRCNCPFRLQGIYLPDGKLMVKVTDGKHNHNLALSLEGHSFGGRLKTEEKKLCEHMTKSGVPPRCLMATLKQQNPLNVTTIRHIYNLRAAMNVRELQGRTIMQQVMKDMTEHKYIYYEQKDPKSEDLISLFFAHPRSIVLARCFSDVLIVDCTYKTNKYKMPLFEIVGQASTGHTFNVAFCFMTKETVEHYSWCLDKLKSLFHDVPKPRLFITDREFALINAIEIVFPDAMRMLCDFHIKKKVEAKCRTSFKSDEEGKPSQEFKDFFADFEGVTYATTEAEYFGLLEKFESRWKDEHDKQLKYIQDTWWVHKELFVKAWTNKIKHFGNTTTNRVEQAHHALKKWIERSVGHFHMLFKHIHDMVTIQLTKINCDFENSLMKRMHEHKNLRWMRPLRCHVSLHALNIIANEVKEAMMQSAMSTRKCLHVLRYTHGLPCWCDIQKKYLDLDKDFSINDIDPRWRQLTFEQVTPEERNKVDLTPQLSMLQKEFEEASEDRKYMLQSKLVELVHPHLTDTCEPSQPIKGKGRPSKSSKAARTTMREPCHFEHVEQQLLNAKKSKIAHKKMESIVTRSSESQGFQAPRPKCVVEIFSEWKPIPHIKIVSLLPSMMQPFIESSQDVLPDGNCGYRAIANQLGYDEEFGWQDVKAKMTIEIKNNKALYRGFMEPLVIQEMYDGLHCRDSPCAEKYWMGMNESGPVIAMAFVAVVVFISNGMCVTFLPYRKKQPTFRSPKFIFFGMVNTNHYVSLTLKPNSPYPPLPNDWEVFRDIDAKYWWPVVNTRIERYLNEVDPPKPKVKPSERTYTVID